MIDGAGRRISTVDGAQQVPGLNELVDPHLAVIRTEFGRFPRQVSGYSLEHLLPENGRNLTSALVGSEGTFGVVTGGDRPTGPDQPSSDAGRARLPGHGRRPPMRFRRC